MKNDAVVGGKRISIPPTLLASTIAIVPDVRRAVTLEAAVVGEVLVLVGDTREELGGTEWAAARGLAGGEVPRCRPAEFWPRYEAVARAIRDELVVASHAVGRGGLLPARSSSWPAPAAWGWASTWPPRRWPPGTSWEGLLYGETPGRFLLACRPEKMDRLRRAARPACRTPSSAPSPPPATSRSPTAPRSLVDGPVDELARAWKRQGGRRERPGARPDPGRLRLQLRGRDRRRLPHGGGRGGAGPPHRPLRRAGPAPHHRLPGAGLRGRLLLRRPRRRRPGAGHPHPGPPPGRASRPSWPAAAGCSASATASRC